MKVLLVNRKRPEKMKYEVVPWGRHAGDGAALGLAESPIRVGRRKLRLTSSPPPTFRIVNLPFVPDFVVAMTAAFLKLFSHHN